MPPNVAVRYTKTLSRVAKRYFTLNLVSGVLNSKPGTSIFSLTVKSPLRLLGTRHECSQAPLQENSRAAV